MARFIPTYDFMDGRGEAFMSVAYVDDRFSNDANTIVLPAYTKVDAGFIYDINDSRASGWSAII